MALTATMIADRGYHQTSLDDIAERLDVSKASIYHYFAGKEALVRATLTTCADYSIRELSAVIAAGGTATERLRGLISRHVHIVSVESVEMSQLFLQPVDWPPAIAEMVTSRNRDHIRVFRDVLDEGAVTGEFDFADGRTANMIIQGAMMLAPSWLGTELRGRRGHAALEQLVDDMLRLIAPKQ